MFVVAFVARSFYSIYFEGDFLLWRSNTCRCAEVSRFVDYF